MKNTKLYVLVGVLTLGNIGFRLAFAESGPEARLVSHLDSGDRVESVELDRLLADFSDAGARACRTVVAFNPDCPHCQVAARREHSAERGGTYEETLWITDEVRPRLGAFVAGLAPGSRHAVAPEAFRALDVDAVPALFLLDAAGTLRWVGAYRGDENGELLAERCEGPDGSRWETSPDLTVLNGR